MKCAPRESDIIIHFRWLTLFRNASILHHFTACSFCFISLVCSYLKHALVNENNPSPWIYQQEYIESSKTYSWGKQEDKETGTNVEYYIEY